MSGNGEVTYGDYLNLDRILDAQNPPGHDGTPRELAHHDEMLFVVIHQVYELWFKQAMHEAVHARNMLAADEVPESDVPRVVAAMNRIHEIFRIAVAQFSVLETMTPADFLAFREHLGSASGFQSAQFREFEILAGSRREPSHRIRRLDLREPLQRCCAGKVRGTARGALAQRRDARVARAHAGRGRVHGEISHGVHRVRG